MTAQPNNRPSKPNTRVQAGVHRYPFPVVIVYLSSLFLAMAILLSTILH